MVLSFAKKLFANWIVQNGNLFYIFWFRCQTGSFPVIFGSCIYSLSFCHFSYQHFKFKENHFVEPLYNKDFKCKLSDRFAVFSPVGLPFYWLLFAIFLICISLKFVYGQTCELYFVHFGSFTFLLFNRCKKIIWIYDFIFLVLSLKKIYLKFILEWKLVSEFLCFFFLTAKQLIQYEPGKHFRFLKSL